MPFLIILAAVLLQSCTDVSEKDLSRSLNIESNAYFVAFRDGRDEAWEVIQADNKTFDIKGHALRVDDPSKRYSLVMACPSDRIDKENEVVLVHSTTSEQPKVDFICRKPVTAVNTGVVFGEVLNTNEDEMTAIGATPDDYVEVMQSYALRLLWGTYDLIAYKGKREGDVITPVTHFLISRDLRVRTTNPSGRNVNFKVAGRSEVNSVTEASPNDVANFNFNSAGLNPDESIHAEVGFITNNNSYLRLGSSSQSGFQYQGVPLLITDSNPSNFKTGQPFQLENEGHQAILEVKRGEELTRSAVRLFKQSTNVSLAVPRLPATQPSFTVSTQDGSALPLLQWDDHFDENFGSAVLDQWIIKGQVFGTESELSKLLNTELVWRVSVSRQWLGGGSRQVQLPDLRDLPDWQSTWQLRANTDLEWQLDKYASSNIPGDILNFINELIYTDQLRYGHTHLSGVVSQAANP